MARMAFEMEFYKAVVSCNFFAGHAVDESDDVACVGGRILRLGDFSVGQGKCRRSAMNALAAGEGPTTRYKISP